MQFPSPHHFLRQATGASSPPEEAHSDPFQWEKFDDLFDKVFATSSTEAAAKDFVPMPRAVPGAFLRRTTSSGGESSSDDSVAGDLFERAWDDAVRKTKKTVTTTTKRRIIRHTPPAVPVVAPPPTPSRLQMPSPAIPSRLKYPRTPYPRSDESPEESSDEQWDSSPETLMAQPSPRSSSAKRGMATLKIPESVLTPELHSPVLWKPQPMRESTEWETTTFEMPSGLNKNDINVGFTNTPGNEKVTVSWQHTEITEVMTAGKLVRERKERKYMRTLPLPKGVKFDQVQANMGESVLTITYPKTTPGPNFGRPRPVEVLQLRR